MTDIYKKLLAIQNELKAPKKQYNSFGNYNYRSQEDVLESVKPLLEKHDLYLFISDEVKESDLSTYVEATVTLTDGDKSISVKAQAGVQQRKEMDISQCFGASSSYARKYALNGLFLIDDVRDADNLDNSSVTDEKQWLNKDDPKYDEIKQWVNGDKSNIVKLRKKYAVSKAVENDLLGEIA